MVSTQASGSLPGNEKTVVRLGIGKNRDRSAHYFVGRGDDARGGGLAENRGEMDMRDAPARDEVGEHVAGAHRRELVIIADENKRRRGLDAPRGGCA